MMTRRIFTILFLTSVVAFAQTPMKYDNFTHQVFKPPVSAGSIYDYDFTGLSLHGISGGGAPPGGTTGQFQFNAGSGLFGGMPTINTTGGAAVVIDADNVIFDQSGAATKKFHFNGVNVTAGTNRAVNIADGTSTTVIPDAGDANSVLTGITTAGAITKGPVTDAQSVLLSKPSCRVLSTTNVASLSGLPTTDGITLSNNDTILLTNQTTGSQSGPWVVHSGAWTRPTWYASGNTVQATQYITILIREGTLNGGSEMFQTASGTITIDTTTTTWARAALAINNSTVTNGVTGTGAVVLQTSPTITTPSESSPTITGHETIEGVTATGATGTGKFVFDGTPTINTQVIAGGLTASGSGANSFAGSTGQFLTSSGANTLNGTVTITPPIRTSGVLGYFTLNPPSDTGITAGSESVGYVHNTATRTWVDGTVAVQRENLFAGPTYNKATTSATFTDPFTMSISGPSAGSGVTFTRPHSLGIIDGTSASSSITGGLVVSTTIGTTATSVGIGGGNVNAGGNGTFGGTLSVTGHDTLEGVTSTGATGTGKHVYDTSPTFQTGVTLNSAPLTMSGNISSAAWTTNGLRVKGVAATFTDTTSSGTVAAAYTDAFGGNTIAASSATTFTDYYTLYAKDPVQGTNVTLTNKWGLGGDSLKAGTSNQFAVNNAGHVTIEGVTSTGATGTGKNVFDTSPTLVTPLLGTPTSEVGTNLTGTGASFTAGNATKWTTGRTISTTGDVTYTSASLDGSANVTAAATVANVPAAATHGSDLTAVPTDTGGWNEYFVTTTDFTTTTLTAGTDITGLVSGTLSNSTVYEFQFNLRLLNAADAAGMKIAIHGAGTGTAATVFCTFNTNSTTASAAAAQGLNVVDTLCNAALVSYSLGEGIVSGSGFFKSTSTGTAQMSLQLAKVTSNTATCRVGSVLRIRKAHT